MPERPFLLFPEPLLQRRGKLSGGGGKLRRPTAEQQRQRLDDEFQRIAESLNDIQTTVEGIEPEQVIVLETVGASVERVATAAARIPGLEWVAEQDLADAEAADGFADARDPRKPLTRRLYALFANQQGIADLLELWRNWYTDPAKSAKRYFGPFKELFAYLKDIRRWGPQDRVADTGVLEYWEENLKVGAPTVLVEVELWPRQDEGRRLQVYQELERRVLAEGGRCLTQTAILEILYHGVLAELPTESIRVTVERILRGEDTQLLRCEQVMFFRAAAQSRAPRPSDETPVLTLQDRLRAEPSPAGPPVAALLDGLPLERHVALAGRLVIDDPDDHTARYQDTERFHGTAMASLIVHGDLGSAETPVSRPLYVRPLYIPSQDFSGAVYEVTPTNSLLVDLLHRAVRRIKEGEGDQPPVAPAVRIINLSLGNPYQPFLRNLSPLARLLDWLAWKYNVLFLVSAGNQNQAIRIPGRYADWRAASAGERLRAALAALRNDQAFRRPFSPAEAVNVITVGAVHADAGPVNVPETDIRVDVLGAARLPAAYATVANGYRRSLKPEVLLPGGRQLFRPQERDGSTVFTPLTANPVGQLTAAPGQRAMELDRVRPSCGSSNATALGTRAAHLIFERLEQLRNEAGGERLDEDYTAVLLKALLVHGASWGDAADRIAAAFSNDFNRRQWRDLQRLQGRFLGYGEVTLERCLVATDQRVTVLGWGRIGAEEGHRLELPLPPSLASKTIRRRLTTTLAWLTPINPRHKDYRKAQLWFDAGEGSIGVSKKDLDADSARRGTVQHRIAEGEAAVPFVDGARLQIMVNCTADAGPLTDTIPYGIAVTLEVAEGLEINLYEEIAARIRPQVPVTP